MKKELLGVNTDGSPRYHYIAEEGETLVLTGPVVAVLTMEDGTVYDVTDTFVPVREEHHDELLHALSEHYQTNGHPHHADGHDFVYDREASEKVLADRRAARKVK